MSKLKLSYFLFLYIAFIPAQKKPELIWPLDSPRVLTGNYGELRPNHFHAGLDFSTNGKVNLQVYAIEEGYVSRVRVSPVGYGKSVYVTHPNGKTSVYGHLNAFSFKIDKIVKEEQIAKQNYEIDFYPRPYSVFLRKNEIIGLSGNTGGSSGPHLHFELRDEKSETPLNPLNYFHVHDDVAPTLESIGFYNLADTSSPAWIKSYHIHRKQISTDTLVMNESILGFAFSGFDQFYTHGNHNNVYSAKLYLDDTLIYSHQFNHIDFNEHRFLNEFSEQIGGYKYQRCFLPTVYPSDFCNEGFNKGRIVLKDLKSHRLKLLLNDESGNLSQLFIYVRSREIHSYVKELPRTDGFVDCSKNSQIRLNGLSVFVPARSFYYNTSLRILDELEHLHHFQLQPVMANLSSTISVGFLPPENLKTSVSSLVLRGSHATYTPTLRGDSVFYAIKSLGDFQVLTDLEAPTVKAHFSNHHFINADTKTLSFSIHDNLSGIGKYNLFIKDQWVITEYDAKSDLLIYYFDETSPIGELNLRLEVSDKVGNKQIAYFQLNR